MTPTIIPTISPMPISSDSATILGGLFLGSFMFVGLSFIFWLMALIDILKSEFKNSNNKIIWLIVTVLLPFLGPILYFLIGRTQVKKGSGISLKVFFTIVMFFVWYPIGIVSMWFWTKWPMWVKIMITLIGAILASVGVWGRLITS